MVGMPSVITPGGYWGLSVCVVALPLGGYWRLSWCLVVLFTVGTGNGRGARFDKRPSKNRFYMMFIFKRKGLLGSISIMWYG